MQVSPEECFTCFIYVDKYVTHYFSHSYLGLLKKSGLNLMHVPAPLFIFY
jgi:hypothetical protein